MKKITFDLSRTNEGLLVSAIAGSGTQVYFVMIVTADVADRICEIVTRRFPGASYKIEDAN